MSFRSDSIIIDVLDFSEEEIWMETNPSMGDHIRVNRGLYNHHGIYLSDEEVIHFTGEDDDSVLDWSKNKVICTNLQRFLMEGTLEIKQYTEEELEDLYPVDHIAAYARACLGDAGYDLIFNNCEHFANVCTLGRYKSHQVEKVFNILLRVPERRRTMGLFKWVKNLFSGNSSSGGNRSTSTSTTTTTYEPDKVRMAEIEHDTKIRLAGMELDKIELMKSAKIEVLEKKYELHEAAEEAKARGLSFLAQTILTLQSKLDEITEKRLEIIEKGSFSIVKDIEGFYKELNDKIAQDDEEYSIKKVPLLLETLSRFSPDSDAYHLYKKRIEDDMSLHVQSISRQYENLMNRQNQITNGLQKSKERILDQTAQITAGIMERAAAGFIEGTTNTLSGGSDLRLEGVESEGRLLTHSKNRLLE